MRRTASVALAAIVCAGTASAQSGTWTYKPSATVPMAIWGFTDEPDAIVSVTCEADAPTPLLSVGVPLPRARAGEALTLEVTVDGARHAVSGRAVDSEFDDGTIATATLPTGGAVMTALMQGRLAQIVVANEAAPALTVTLNGSFRALGALSDACATLAASGVPDAAGPAGAQTSETLPAEPARAIAAQQAECGAFGPRFVAREGFVTRADLNGDGVADVIADYNRSNCTGFCGSGGCLVTVYASEGAGFNANDFLLHDASPGRFACTGGACRVR